MMSKTSSRKLQSNDVYNKLGSKFSWCVFVRLRLFVDVETSREKIGARRAQPHKTVVVGALYFPCRLVDRDGRRKWRTVRPDVFAADDAGASGQEMTAT
jgi:hypothetical protein